MLQRLGTGLCPIRKKSAAAVVSPYLDGVLDSVCCDLDATIEDSYGGSGQTWANLIASPADGADQTDYDFYLGDDGGATADPTFTGSAGDAAAYFALNGSQYFSSKDFSAMPTLYNMHKSGASGSQWWIAMALNPNTTGVWCPWGSGEEGADVGAYGYMDVNGNRALYTCKGGSFGYAGETAAANDSARTQDILLIVSVDLTATTNNVRFWTVSATSQLVSFDFGTLTAEASNSIFAIGATYDDGQWQYRLPSGAKIYSFACGNEYLTDEKAALIFTHLEARHSRDYTP